MPTNVRSVRVTLREEEGKRGEHFLCYTHGLKNHYGNCQRLLHGHRSLIKVFTNGRKNSKLAAQLSKKRFKSNIHFALWDNIVNKQEILSAYPEAISASGIVLEKIKIVHLQYDGSQGHFELKLPGFAVALFGNETTIENLTTNFAIILKKNLKQKDRLIVKGFEGIGKGASATG